MKFKLLFFFITFTYCFSSCKKDQPAVKKKVIDIYVAGWAENSLTGGDAAYWKNGKLVRLKSIAKYNFVKAIAVQDTDVYAVGNSYTSDKGEVISYWKNGKPIYLDTITNAFIEDLAVSGKDVYILTNKNIPAPTPTGLALQPVLWKNNVPITLPIEGSNYSGSEQLLVKGTDVYVTGYITNAQSVNVAVVWKNGQLIKLSDGKKAARASAIAAQGNDIYIGGVGESSKSSAALVWKNMAAADSLFNPHAPDFYTAFVMGLAVNGTDVYVSGLERKSGDGMLSFNYLYWKNGAIKFSNTEASGAVFSNKSYYFNNDLYTAGSIINYCGYWKNQDFVKIASGASGARAVLLVEHD